MQIAKKIKNKIASYKSHYQYLDYHTTKQVNSIERQVAEPRPLTELTIIQLVKINFYLTQIRY